MWRNLMHSAALFAGILTPAIAQTQSVDQILEKYFQALGGLDRMKALEAMRVSGRMTLGQGMEATFVRTTKRPNKVRTEFSTQGMTGIQAYDGENGWVMMPFMGHTEPQPMPPDAARGMREQADIDGPLVDYRAKGHQVELLGRESVGGKPAYKLKVTVRTGETAFYYLDAGSYLLLRTETTSSVEGREFNVVTSFGDYKEVSGLVMAHTITVTSSQLGSQQLIIEKVELNPEIPDEYFRMPVRQDG